MSLWAPGAVTGIGSLPGDDPLEAATLVLGELPDLPHLAELPARGPGAQMIGRSAGLLVELPVEIAPSGWRVAGRPGRDLRRARDLLSRDLDALEQQADGYTGPLKVQAVGPWTLAAELELVSGHRLVTDPGAVRDLIESLAEGIRLHLADVAARVPGASLVLQLDEPSLPTVLAGHLPTPSGYGIVRAIDESVAEQGLGDVLAVGPDGGRAVHCCASEPPLALMRGAGADALSVDLGLLRRRDYDQLGEAVEAGTSLWLGVLPTAAEPSFDAARKAIATLWQELGFAPEQLPISVVPTPACGLADVSPERVRRMFSVLRDVGKSLLDEG